MASLRDSLFHKEPGVTIYCGDNNREALTPGGAPAMTDRLLFTGFLRCYPDDQMVPFVALEPAVRRLEIALAGRGEDGQRLPRRGKITRIPVTIFLPTHRCACGQAITPPHRQCDQCVAFGLTRRTA